MSNSVRILGGAQTDFARNWLKEEKNFADMLGEIANGTLAQVGLELSEIKRLNADCRVGLFLGNFAAELYCKQGHLGAFLPELIPAFSGIPTARYEAACASGSVAVQAANQAIRAGDLDVAIVLGMEVMKTVSPAVGGDYLGTAAWYEKEAKDIEFPFPKLFGKLKDVLEERYKLDPARFRANLTEISNINYANGKRNRLAQTRDWPAPDADEKNTKKMNMPLGSLLLRDCSQVTDGAAGVILASNAYAQDFLKKSGKSAGSTAVLAGWGHRTAPVTFDTKMVESKNQSSILPWTGKAVAEAYKLAGVTAGDVDCFETHDCFTSSEYAAISAFGLTQPGKEFEAVEDGRIAFGGKKPINASGGLIGAGHPVGASGVRMLLDCAKQVTGTAGDYQIKGAKTAAMLNIGGSATTNMVFVVKRGA